MIRKCPSCHGRNVRRSSTPATEVTWRNEVLSPYRCRDCLTQFWVISRRTYIVAGGIVTAIVVAAIAILLLEMLTTPGPYPAKKGRRSEGVHQERVLVAASVMRLIGIRTERLPARNATTAAPTVAGAG
jgi:hypothetical protein